MVDIQITTKPGAKLQVLEGVRGFAACYVLAGHICNVYFGNPGWSFPFRFAAEAVVLFFLLSGFVVRYSTRETETWRDYIIKRARRIYPLFILSLGLSYLLASWGQGAWAEARWADLAGNFLMLQDFGFRRPGVWVGQYYNEALWSLAYECWFYLFFFVLIKVTSSHFLRSMIVAGFAITAMGVHYVWPNQIGYFVSAFSIWWGGAELARQYRKPGDAPQSMILWSAFLVLMAIAWLPALRELPRDEWALGLYPILDIRRFAGAAAIIAIGLAWRTMWNRGGEKLFRATIGPFSLFGPISYGIYVFHFPILNFFVHSKLAASPLLCVGVIVVTVVIVAYLGEVLLQRLINQATDPLLGVRGRKIQSEPLKLGKVE